MQILTSGVNRCQDLKTERTGAALPQKTPRKQHFSKAALQNAVQSQLTRQMKLEFFTN